MCVCVYGIPGHYHMCKLAAYQGTVLAKDWVYIIIYTPVIVFKETKTSSITLTVTKSIVELQNGYTF